MINRAGTVLQWLCLIAVWLPVTLLLAVCMLPVSAPVWCMAYCRYTCVCKTKSRNDTFGRYPTGIEASHEAQSAVTWWHTYFTLLVCSTHWSFKLWAVLARPKVIFVVYHSDAPPLAKLLCFSTMHVLHRWGILPDLQNPSSPWLINIGLISCGPRTGIAIVAGLAPVLSRITKEQLRQLPTVCRVAYPTAKAIALAGRLPGLVKSAGAEVTPPLVDGLAGTVFAMEETMYALQARLPEARRKTAIAVLLGGGGFLGSQLMKVLVKRGKARPHVTITVDADCTAHDYADEFLDGLEDTSHQQQKASGCPEYKPELVAPGGSATKAGFHQVVALDTRFVDRGAKDGVLYTSEPQDLTAADVVLVITASGGDAAGYADYATPGQEWADDTHPEMGHNTLKSLAAKGVNIHKAMAHRTPGTYFLPPLPGWPVNGTPGCLLMALVTAETGQDWNACKFEPACCAGHESKLLGLQETCLKQATSYEEFRAAAHDLGFGARLVKHRPYLS